MSAISENAPKASVQTSTETVSKKSNEVQTNISETLKEIIVNQKHQKKQKGYLPPLERVSPPPTSTDIEEEQEEENEDDSITLRVTKRRRNQIRQKQFWKHH